MPSSVPRTRLRSARPSPFRPAPSCTSRFPISCPRFTSIPTSSTGPSSACSPAWRSCGSWAATWRSTEMRRLEGIYALCDNTLNPNRSHLELAKALLQGGAPILQLRMKGEKDLAVVRRTAQAILELKSDHDFIFLLNDFVELGRELPVDGVHIGQDDMAVEKARGLLGPSKL